MSYRYGQPSKNYRDAVQRAQVREQEREVSRQLRLKFYPQGDALRKRNAAIAELCADHTISTREIAQRFRVSKETVTRINRRAGLPPRRRGLRPGMGRSGSRKPNRDADVGKLRDSGMTLQAIGKELGLSRQRVSQIVQRTGSTFVPNSQRVCAKHNEIRHRILTESAATLAREYGLSKKTIYRICRGIARPRRRTRNEGILERNREIVSKTATMTISAVARHYGLSRTQVQRIRDERGDK